MFVSVSVSVSVSDSDLLCVFQISQYFIKFSICGSEIHGNPQISIVFSWFSLRYIAKFPVLHLFANISSESIGGLYTLSI